MSEALQLFRYIWTKLFTLVFDTFAVESGVTIGWIVLVTGIIAMVIRSILVLPRGINFKRSHRPERSKDDNDN